MNLNEIGLNRYLTKDSPKESSFSYDSVYMASTVGSSGDDSSVKSGSSAFDINQSSVIIRADKIEAQSIDLTKGFYNYQLTSIAPLLDGLRIDYHGITGYSGGNTTFSIDVSGNAFFRGSIDASSITGGTITGATLKTAASGQRVELNSTLASYYNSSNTLIAQTYASGNGFLIKGTQAASNVFIDPGASGAVYFSNNGTVNLFWDPIGSSALFPNTTNAYDLGAITRNWRDLFISGNIEYKGITIPTTFTGYISGTSYVGGNGSGYISVTNPSTGNYTLTHNFGDRSSYVPVVTAVRATGSGAYSVKIESINDDDFKITIFDDGGIARNSEFTYMLTHTA